MTELSRLLREHERALMERILYYAKAQGYAKYTSTLVEAWRVSIKGLTDAVAAGEELYGDALPEFTPEDSFENDPVAAFGLKEARLHRERGVSLSMFLGLYKYYRYAFQDVIRSFEVPPEKLHRHMVFVERCFDRIEIAYCSQWASLDDQEVIRELQRANREMTNEKNKYLTLFESVDLPAFLVDAKGLLDNLNVPGAALQGKLQSEGALYYALDIAPEVRGKRLDELLPWLREPLHRLLEGQEPSFQQELEDPGKAGQDAGHYFFATFSRMRDVSGKFLGGVVVLQDITEHKKMERLKEDVERITRHDLKVPLSGILSIFTSLMEEDDIAQEHKQFLAMGRKSGYAILDMINSSLDIFKMEMGAYRFEPDAVDLRMVLRMVLQNAMSLSKAMVIEPEVAVNGVPLEHAPPGPLLLAEDMLLYTALGNLLTNALEASPTGGPVTIDVTANEDCRIAIANQGGVPEQVKDSFFEKYTTFGKKSGIGLGAYSARLIIETMGGTIDMQSDGYSTVVTVTMKLAE